MNVELFPDEPDELAEMVHKQLGHLLADIDHLAGLRISQRWSMQFAHLALNSAWRTHWAHDAEHLGRLIARQALTTKRTFLRLEYLVRHLAAQLQPLDVELLPNDSDRLVELVRQRLEHLRKDIDRLVGIRISQRWSMEFAHLVLNPSRRSQWARECDDLGRRLEQHTLTTKETYLRLEHVVRYLMPHQLS